MPGLTGVWVGDEKLAAVDQRNHGDQHEQTRGRHRRERGGEVTIGNAGETADQHVLRVSRDGGHAADVRRHGHGQ